MHFQERRVRARGDKLNQMAPNMLPTIGGINDKLVYLPSEVIKSDDAHHLIVIESNPEGTIFRHSAAEQPLYQLPVVPLG